ncbi:MAG: sigma-54-dependent Fis family transcriptional regulator [Candidatus Abyssobacteria bacterium SURF_5]|uniref:Sigma-54-dependent Fis family transcriptional regulator n=1 Tax=Abyssobacteria bacterium (strain SURF_5) TaxID=2093360 RepID=A0A3A4NP24_ABYX5|nr:MAG: sigma-54-dependent Fis family transcriptional regulator [Candidatus Abyssubacteria bacterium SURF_5]
MRLKRKNAQIFIVDDDPLIRYSLRELLVREGFAVQAFEDGETALNFLEKQSCDLIFADINMPGLNGYDLLKSVKEHYGETAVILITAYGSIQGAVNGIKLGAFEYVTKPLNDEEVKLCIDRALEQKSLRLENLELKKQLSEKFGFRNLVGNDHQMQKIFQLISIVADTEATILIAGASGTGKSSIARAIHYHSRRKNQPLVEVSCGALSENLLESELFGHVKGAFTSAVADKIGKIEKAGEGTIFLDEIDTLTLGLQVKLLRFLQDKKFEKVGSAETIQSNVRVIAAANRDLDQCVAKGEFREDLFYRLNVVKIILPPLSERLGDVPALVEYFLDKYNRLNSRHIKGITPEVMKRLLSHSWPGNVRELENTIERAVILCAGDQITPEFLPDQIRTTSRMDSANRMVPLHLAVEDAEKRAIAKSLQHFKGNRNKTAEFLEINRTTLYQKMKKYGLLELTFKV